MPVIINGTTGIDTVQNGIVTDAKLNLTANSQEIKDALNAAGSAPIYSARAWVNFNGTGTVAIRASGNVTSITDNGTGDYIVNFTTAMSDTSYSVATSTGGNTNAYLRQVTANITAAGTVRINTFFSGDNANTPLALADFDPVCVSIFR
jgi:hypothetical protein